MPMPCRHTATGACEKPLICGPFGGAAGIEPAAKSPMNCGNSGFEHAKRREETLGDFVHDNLQFFLQFGAAAPPNGFMPPIDRTAIGAAAENKPVIGRWELGPDEALILEVEPPEGVHWSYSLGNPWWETIHCGRHQSRLNVHQAVVDSDGLVRVVLCGRDPGVANWLDTAGYNNGAMILRCVRTTTAPTPRARVVSFDDVASALPAETKRITPDERASVLERRRRAVHERFAR
jgi:hypothetical protein